MITTLAVIAAGGAISLMRVLPSPVGRRLLALLAVPAYPGVTAYVSNWSSTVGPFSIDELVYLPTVVTACLVAALIWQSRRSSQPHTTAPTDQGPG